MRQQLAINLRYCYSSRTVMGNLSTIMGRMNVHYRWRAAKSMNFILKFYLYLNYEQKYLLLTCYLSNCLYHGASF